MSTAEHRYGDGCPDGSAEHWRDLHEATSRELTELRDAWSRQTKATEVFSRNSADRTRAEIWEALTGYQFGVMVDAAARPLTSLIRAAQNLPDKPGRADVDVVRMLAADAALLLEDRAGRDAVLTELYRLRRATVLAGQWLHNQLADESRMGGCLCIGCELARIGDQSGGAA